jgi:hypothetical protein
VDDDGPCLERRTEPFRHPLRRPFADGVKAEESKCTAVGRKVGLRFPQLKFLTRERSKPAAKTTTGRPVESAANEKIKGRLRRHFLDDFLNCLENPAGFSTATTGPAIEQLTTELKTNGRPFTQNY